MQLWTRIFHSSLQCPETSEVAAAARECHSKCCCPGALLGELRDQIPSLGWVSAMGTSSCLDFSPGLTRVNTQGSVEKETLPYLPAPPVEHLSEQGWWQILRQGGTANHHLIGERCQRGALWFHEGLIWLTVSSGFIWLTVSSGESEEGERCSCPGNLVKYQQVTGSQSIFLLVAESFLCATLLQCPAGIAIAKNKALLKVISICNYFVGSTLSSAQIKE